MLFREGRNGKEFFEIETLYGCVNDRADFAEGSINPAGFVPPMEAGGEIGFAFAEPRGKFAGEESLGLGGRRLRRRAG